MPLVVRSNHAGRFGGGLFQEGCNEGLNEKSLCWIGGISDQTAASFILSFEKNTAGGAGGGIYTTCYSLGICEAVIKITVGLPTTSSNRGEIVSFFSNKAVGYGENVASAPSELVLRDHINYYVPGETKFNVTFSMLDARGQVIVSSNSEQQIVHMVQLLVLPAQTDCVSFESCVRFKLQPTGT